jgi:hypothetical protein
MIRRLAAICKRTDDIQVNKPYSYLLPEQFIYSLWMGVVGIDAGATGSQHLLG